jgi:hypothetical protein
MAAVTRHPPMAYVEETAKYLWVMWLKIGLAGQISVEVLRIEYQPLGHM